MPPIGHKVPEFPQPTSNCGLHRAMPGACASHKSGNSAAGEEAPIRHGRAAKRVMQIMRRSLAWAFFAALRSRTIENFNESLKAIFVLNAKRLGHIDRC